MRQQPALRAAIGLPALLPLLALGCVTGRPVAPSWQALDNRDHTYCFVVNGMDFTGCGNLAGLADHVRGLGFRNTCYGQFYHWGPLLDQICKVWKDDPQAQIVLVGFSAGGYGVRDLANDLNTRNIPVTLIVYLAADLLRDTPHVWPANVNRVVHIYGHAFMAPINTCLFRGVNISRARNIYLDTRHIAVPRHPTTIAVVTQEMLALVSPPANEEAENTAGSPWEISSQGFLQRLATN